jgi:gamma-glutamylcyclotransferase (GGCT)/AIG2-like uncharacterized protein YtfP
MKAKTKLAPRRASVKKRKASSPRVATPQHLFVYGTLKRGGRNYARLRTHKARFVRTARIRAELYQVPGEKFSTAVLTDAGDKFVRGELFALRNPHETRALDEFEGVPDGLFRRQLVAVCARSRRVEAWTYLYARSLQGATLIPSGIYSAH